MTRVKICGIKQAEHGLVALESGADFLGFIFHRPSHRYVEPTAVRAIVSRCRAARPVGWRAVGVFVDWPLDELNRAAETADVDLIQLAGAEDPAYCAAACRPVIKVVRIDAAGRALGSTDPRDWNSERILLDTHHGDSPGGTGLTYDWAAARRYASEALLAGGLTPENARRAIRLAQPWGLDVSSGVERDKHKDPDLIRRFLHEVKTDDRAN